MKKIFLWWKAEMKRPIIGIRLSDRDTNTEVHRYEITVGQLYSHGIIIALLIRVIVDLYK